MSMPGRIRVRPSLRELQAQYERNHKKPLEDLIRAWRGIKELPPEDPNSFFRLAGYHGEPFIYRPEVDKLTKTDTYLYWGGYCNHGNVLFPTWHRVYVLKIEEALQSIVPDVMMPYWDETSPESLQEGIPWVLTQEKFELDGEMIDNPLRSFVLPMALSDDMNFPSAGDTDHMYAKPKGYETVRYPLSGLVGTPAARKITKEHNANYADPEKNIELLNANVKQWLTGVPPKQPGPTTPAQKHSVYWRYKNCLEAPTYTAFSNTTSAAAWNRGASTEEIVTPLEDPHNDIHLAVGGFDSLVTGPNYQEDGIIAGANGDMGENNTAAMDPIFFFHHCNVDRMFWLWQKRNGYKDELPIIKNYPGTSSTDSQGPTPGVPPNAALNIETPLRPFMKDEDGLEVFYTSQDCINIETQLNYTYSPGSFDGKDEAVAEESYEGFSTKKLVVTGIDRALFQGSFILRAYAIVGDETYYLGHHAVLSRRNVVKCANCLTHLEVQAHFPLSNVPADAVDQDLVEYHLELQHRGPQLHQDLVYEFEVKD